LKGNQRYVDVKKKRQCRKTKRGKCSTTGRTKGHVHSTTNGKGRGKFNSPGSASGTDFKKKNWFLKDVSGKGNRRQGNQAGAAQGFGSQDEKKMGGVPTRTADYWEGTRIKY